MEPKTAVKVIETTGLSVAPDARKFALAHMDGSISLWNVDGCCRVNAMTVHGHVIVDIKCFANDKIMAASGNGSLGILTVDDSVLGRGDVTHSPRGSAASESQRYRTRLLRETFGATLPGTA